MTEAYEVGGRRIGVRWTRTGLDAELRALAGGALGRHDAPPNLSVVVGERSGHKLTKHQLTVQGRLLCVTGHDGGLLRALVRALGTLVAGAPPGTVALSAFLVIDPSGIATIVDHRLAAQFRRLEPRLRRAGHRVVEPPTLFVRPASATVSLPDSAGAVGVSRRALDRRWPLEGADDDLVAGDVAVSKLVYGCSREPESLAFAMAEMMPLVRDGAGLVRTTDVERLSQLAQRLPTEPVPGHDPGHLRRVLGLS
ncbi:MAG: hypothetical protein ACRD0N_07580 [Acidimicrobiales bacterium]